MENTVEQLTKLATDLTDRVDALLKENAQLKSDLEASKMQLKQASEQKAPEKPSVSEATVDATLDALVKLGSLTDDQRAECRAAMLQDPEVPYRIIGKFIDAAGQTKTAADESNNVSGGRLVSKTAAEQLNNQLEEECFERMRNILNM